MSNQIVWRFVAYCAVVVSAFQGFQPNYGTEILLWFAFFLVSLDKG